MAKWTDYTIDTNPTDTDEVMTLDTDKTPKANKRVTLSTLADYFLGKLASKVFAKLETQNQTVIGALNELNSKALVIPLNLNVKCNINYDGGLFEYNRIYICTVGKDTTSDIIGFPSGAYGYGLLFCVMGGHSYTSFQLYVSHYNEILTRNLGARDLNKNYWIDGNGNQIPANT